MPEGGVSWSAQATTWHLYTISRDQDIRTLAAAYQTEVKSNAKPKNSKALTSSNTATQPPKKPRNVKRRNTRSPEGISEAKRTKSDEGTSDVAKFRLTC